MNYYPEQLRRIASMCEALNAVDKVPDVAHIVIKSRVPLVDPADDQETPVGYLVDEIGGAWSFEPVGGAE